VEGASLEDTGGGLHLQPDAAPPPADSPRLFLAPPPQGPKALDPTPAGPALRLKPGQDLEVVLSIGGKTYRLTLRLDESPP
jgi:hypothetical protein